jgi:hypothetical protein
MVSSSAPQADRSPWSRGRLGDAAYGLICSTLARLRWGRQRPPTSVERAAISRLREDVSESIDQLDGTVTPEWQRFARRIAELIENDDPRRFRSWDVVQWTASPTLLLSIRRDYARLRSQSDYRTFWRPALAEQAVGRPIPFPLAPFTSANRIVLAHHLLVLREWAGQAPRDLDVIVEFGGGFGGLEALTRELGFNGTYAIVDLPELRALQRFYLTLAGSPVVDEGSEPRGRKTVLLSLDRIDEIDARLQSEPDSLFVGTWSLSEAPLAARAPVIARLAACRHALIAYQESFGGIDNSNLFASITEHTDADMIWRNLPVPHSEVSGIPRDWYAIGTHA